MNSWRKPPALHTSWPRGLAPCYLEDGRLRPQGKGPSGSTDTWGFPEACFFFVKSPIFGGLVGKMAELTPWLINGDDPKS